MNKSLKQIFITLSSLAGLFIFFVAFIIFIGIPTIQDNYVEIETQKSKVQLLSNELVDVTIEFIPEELDRLIIYIEFDKKTEELILKDFSIKLFDKESNQYLERIFTIRVFKPENERPEFYDEIRLENDFNEIDLESKYRDLSYTVQPQFKLGDCDNFEVSIQIELLEKLSNEIIQINKKLTIENESRFKMEEFRIH